MFVAAAVMTLSLVWFSGNVPEGWKNTYDFFVIFLSGEWCKRGKSGTQAGGVTHTAGWE